MSHVSCKGVRQNLQMFWNWAHKNTANPQQCVHFQKLLKMWTSLHLTVRTTHPSKSFMMLGNVAKNLIMFVIFCITLFFFYSYYYICLVLFCLYVYGVLPWYKVDDLPKTWAVNPEHRVLLHMNMYIKYKLFKDCLSLS